MGKNSKRSKRRKKAGRRKATRSLYFAYGSNLDKRAFLRRAPDAQPVGRATLADWRLTFRGVADIEEAADETVQGALWLVSKADLRAIDRYEGRPHYYDRTWVDVDTDRGPRRAVTYVMVSTWDEGLPSPSYYKTIARGYRDFGLPLKALSRALCQTRVLHRSLGIDRYVPAGKKRMRAVMRPLSDEKPRKKSYVATGWSDDGYDDPRAGMSPATRRLELLEQESVFRRESRRTVRYSRGDRWEDREQALEDEYDLRLDRDGIHGEIIA